MRAVIYTRVSSDPNELGRSVAEQEAECRAVAAREGWEVVQVFSDNDRSASRHARRDRPRYKALKEFLLSRGADVLVLWEGSRAQRDLRDFLALRDLCAESGVRYSYSGRTYDLSRTDDRFTTGLDALLAERESDVTRDRVLRAVKANATSGRPHGRLQYGYRRLYDDAGRYLSQVEHPQQAAVVREAAKRVASGDSCRAVALDLNRRGICAPEGGLWTNAQIRRLVVNPSYVGERVYRGRVIGEAGWPPLVDRETHDLCVATAGDPLRRDSHLRHLLSGILRCAVCGAPMYVISPRGYETYTCKSGFCVAARTTGIEQYITSLILTVYRQDQARVLLGRRDTTDPTIPEKIRKLEAEREANQQAYEDGLVAAEMAGRRDRKLDAAIAELRGQLRPDTAPTPVGQMLDASDVDAAWERMPVLDRRQVVAHMADLRVGRTKSGTRRFDFWRLGGSRWVGDPLTWGEHWAAVQAQ